MDIVFRLDASQEIGSGHFVRSLSLAKALKIELKQNLPMHITFLCRELPNSFAELLRIEKIDLVRFTGDESAAKKAFYLHKKNVSATTIDFDQLDFAQQVLVVFDHYQISQTQEQLWRPSKIWVIDDLMNRQHDCDLLIDNNQHTQNDYTNLLTTNAKILLGPSFSLLRPEFIESSKKLLPFEKRHGILMFWGGTDPRHQSLSYAQLIYEISKNPQNYCHNILLKNPVHLLVTSLNPDLLEIKRIPKNPLMQLYVDEACPWQAMKKCSAYLGSGGTITWERMCLGLTGVVISVAENQIDNAQNLHQMNLHKYLGDSKQCRPDTALKTLCELLNSPSEIAKMSLDCLNLVDGKGIERILKIGMPLLYS